MNFQPDDPLLVVKAQEGRLVLGRRDRRAQVERGVVGEDLGLQVRERRAWLESEVLGHPGPSPLERGERVGLAAAPIERDHQQPRELLVGGVIGDQARQLGDHLGVPAEEQRGLAARFQR